MKAFKTINVRESKFAQLGTFNVFGHEDNDMGTVHLIGNYATKAAADKKAAAVRKEHRIQPPCGIGNGEHN